MQWAVERKSVANVIRKVGITERIFSQGKAKGQNGNPPGGRSSVSREEQPE